MAAMMVDLRVAQLAAMKVASSVELLAALMAAY
jgi:hypothetical protein